MSSWPMGTYGGRLVLLRIFGGLWGSMGTTWGLWEPTGTLCVPVGTYGDLQGLIGTFGVL